MKRKIYKAKNKRTTRERFRNVKVCGFEELEASIYRETEKVF